MDILTKVKDPDTLLVEGQVAAAGGDMVRKEVQERSELGTVYCLSDLNSGPPHGGSVLPLIRRRMHRSCNP